MNADTKEREEFQNIHFDNVAKANEIVSAYQTSQGVAQSRISHASSVE